MADNFTANAGSGGSTFAADDISSVLYPRVKLSLGADGSATDCSTSNPIPAQLYPGTSGGLTIGPGSGRTLISAATTNATSIKGSAGQVYSILATNTNAAVRYLKLYNKATSPTVGSDTPVMTLAIPGSTTGGGFTATWPNGVAFGTGIACALTTGVADADTGAVAANEILVTLLYK